jgi:hypothetical protein
MWDPALGSTGAEIQTDPLSTAGKIGSSKENLEMSKLW